MTKYDKGHPCKRETAKKLLERTIEKVHEYNRNPDNPIAITEMVVFGSYVNDPKKMMLGDLDIALGVSNRYPKTEQKVCEDNAWDRILKDYPPLGNIPSYVNPFEQHAFKTVKMRSRFIEIHRWENNPEKGDMPYILKDAHEHIDVGPIIRSGDAEDGVREDI